MSVHFDCNVRFGCEKLCCALVCGCKHVLGLMRSKQNSLMQLLQGAASDWDGSFVPEEGFSRLTIQPEALHMVCLQLGLSFVWS